MSSEVQAINNQTADNGDKFVEPLAVRAYNSIPYALLNQEMGLDGAKRVIDDFHYIKEYYRIYHQGARFNIEGTNDEYVGANLKYMTTASLINKEARFLFAEAPDITVVPKGNVETLTDDIKSNVGRINSLVETILNKNNFEESLIKVARDCFIGKRAAALVNFNQEDGCTITFLPATQFLYEFKENNANVLSKFVAFVLRKDSNASRDKIYFKKKYELIDEKIYLTEEIMDGAGRVIETPIESQLVNLTRIPAVIFLNDGLTGDLDGESDIANMAKFESEQNRLGSGDIDSIRKNMNPVTYTIDMNPNSTKKLTKSPGSHWDLSSDQALPQAKPAVGIIESSLGYSQALKTTVDRLKAAMYDTIDMPDISLESLQGVVTSYKGFKGVYWNLIVRCKEKMKMWGPQLTSMVELIIEGSYAFPKCLEKYKHDPLVVVDYDVEVEGNIPLPEDEVEEKTSDLNEVDAQTMSRQRFMKKWYKMTDAEVFAELKQIATEREILEDAYMEEGNGGLGILNTKIASDLGIEGEDDDDDLEEGLEDGRNTGGTSPDFLDE